MNEIILPNPITNFLKSSLESCKRRLNFAVPFLSSYGLSLLYGFEINKIHDKRLLTKFDDSSITSFDIPTLESLLDFGFNIRYDNTIHLKLYIIDDDTYVTSSNLTKGGFEDNVELTVKVDTKNTKECIDIFNEIWKNCSKNVIDHKLLNSSYEKYNFLRKKERSSSRSNLTIRNEVLIDVGLDISKIVDEIFNSVKSKDFSKQYEQIFEANKRRNRMLDRIRKGFKTEIFYAPPGHPKRRDNLFFELAYGFEGDLAGTGLREVQFETVFKHTDFRNVINYILPEMIGMKPWNLKDNDSLMVFCNGIFDFDIPQYNEAIPIRLASFFYPEIFLPIFKLSHLEKVSEALGLSKDVQSKGEKLYTYNSFISRKMNVLPFDNHIKMSISYSILYTVELFNRLKNGEKYDSIIADFKEAWKKRKILEGKELLTRLKVIAIK